jgi:hypothetical protein
MRHAVTILTLGLIAGCAARPQAALPSRESAREEIAAVSLVFDPAIVLEEGAVYVPRDGRAPEVFLGYDEITATFLYIRTDDQQNDLYGDRFQRRALYHLIGVRYR